MLTIHSDVFRLDTPKTTYLFRISETGHPEHLYYGPRMDHVGDLACYRAVSSLRMPTIVNYSEEAPRTYLTMLPLETSSYGKGDLREAAFTGELGKCGNAVFDFTYESYRIESDAVHGSCRSGTVSPREEELRTAGADLPEARKNGAETLVLALRDRVNRVGLELFYTVYPDSDVIVRRTRVVNDSGEELLIRSCYSMQLDLTGSGFEALTFDGAWMREREVHRTPLSAGSFGVQSAAGASSAEHNPLLLLSHESGAYLFNLIWSGDHREIAEVSPYDTLRVLTGVNPSTFSWTLAPGGAFSTPEAIMVYSEEGERGVTREAHEFVRNYISPLNWKGRERPILLNSWEGMGYELSEERIRAQAEAAKELGIELFVIDDGWFRRQQRAVGDLGDWTVVESKFPRGLKPVTEHLHSIGMMAGIWIEPEMISIESCLYEEHPDYLVKCPGRAPSPGRDQYLLDLTRDEVVEVIFKKLEALIGENGFDYVKWDMNRYMADDFSQNVRGMEFRYRWMLGVYRLLRKVTERFPELLLEGCASGGGRYDLGLLCYVNQYWGSDNTDATCRVSIWNGTSFGYPQDTFGAHVSRIPNGLTGRVYDYETAFAVNAFGAFGYELDVTKLSEDELVILRDQIEFYKMYRYIFQFGRFTNVSDSNTVIWTSESEDASVILALMLEKRMTCAQEKIRRLRVPSCRADRMYRVTARRQRVTNPLMCEKRGGMHQSEEFSCVAPGALLRSVGMTVMPVFLGTDYPEYAAYTGDFGTRLFVIEELTES